MKIPIFSAQTEWVIPTEFPDLTKVDEIAIDLETRDPDLIKSGSSVGITHSVWALNVGIFIMLNNKELIIL